MSRETFDALRDATARARPVLHRGLSLAARAMRVACLAPWDLTAPPPPHLTPTSPIPLAEGLSTLSVAFEEAVTGMGAFVEEAVKRRWIDARQGPHRRPGGLATVLWRSKAPRIFLNWSGSPVGLRICAHELGHGFHLSRVADHFRSLDDYSWALLEVPSTFAELTAGDHLIATASTPAARCRHIWQDVLYAMKMLGTSSFGLDLSLAMEDLRTLGWLTPEGLDECTERIWQQWFGDAVRPTSRTRWLDDHHLYLASTRHTGFLYQVAWFVAQALVARRQRLGVSVFTSEYLPFLRALHRGSVEEALERHFQISLDTPEVWNDGVARVVTRLDQLEALLDQMEV
jgi:oligoendopeptidase F